MQAPLISLQIYSSMPDHNVSGQGWPAAPLWASKYTIENYVRQVRRRTQNSQRLAESGD